MSLRTHNAIRFNNEFDYKMVAAGWEWDVDASFDEEKHEIWFDSVNHRELDTFKEIAEKFPELMCTAYCGNEYMWSGPDTGHYDFDINHGKVYLTRQYGMSDDGGIESEIDGMDPLLEEVTEEKIQEENYRINSFIDTSRKELEEISEKLLVLSARANNYGSDSMIPEKTAVWKDIAEKLNESRNHIGTILAYEEAKKEFTVEFKAFAHSYNDAKNIVMEEIRENKPLRRKIPCPF